MKQKRPITLTPAQIKKLKVEITNEATDKAMILFLLAAHDEFEYTDDELCRVAERADRYAGYIDQKIVPLRETQEILERHTGMKLKGW